jgi:uncharacterized membrane protein
VISVTLEQGYGILTMLAVAAVAVLLAGLFYARAFGVLERRQRWTLFSLRVAAILLVVLLLFRPVFSYTKALKERPSLVFAVDQSASMSIADDAAGKTRFQQASDQVAAWWPKLADDFDLHLLTFSDRVWKLDDVRRLATGVPDGKATSLSRALRAAAGQVPKKDLEAVILLSDGIHNTARSPLEVAGALGSVVHAVGVGASLRGDASYRDIQVTGVDCPDRLMLNNMAKITASIEGIGLDGRVTQVVLEDDGQQISQAELTLDNVEGPQEVAFQFRPTVKGRHGYTVRVAPAGEERIKENNQRTAIALVVEPGIRVLYIEGTLRAEYGALVDRFLAKDPDLEFCALVQTRPNEFVRRTNIEGFTLESIPNDEATIDTFDVFIFGDLDSSYFRPEQQELFVKRIRAGAGLVMLGGYHSLGPGGYAAMPLGKILPVEPGNREIGQITEPFLPTLTPEGARHPIFANIADFFGTEAGEPKTPGLPSLLGCTRVEAVQPGAAVLATCPVDPRTPPVLAVQPVDQGRTAVFTGDTTRRWQQGPRALGQDSPFLRFWGQMVRWLAGRTGTVETTAGVVGSTDKAYYEPDEPIGISAVVRDDKGEGARDAKVVARLRGPAGGDQTVTLSAVPGPEGHYGGTCDPGTPGTYAIEIEATVGPSKLTAEKLVVDVGRPNLEFEKLDLDDKLLGRIAADTGGRYVHITTADLLVDQLDRAQREKTVYLEGKLYWPPAFWAMFVGVLVTEWVLRRRFQLR